MDKIKIKLPHIGKNLKPIIKIINFLYKNIEYGVLQHTKQTIQLNNQNKMCIFSIFRYLYENNMLSSSLNKYSHENQHIFKEIIATRDKSRLTEWINSYGRHIMNHLNYLVTNNRIPSNLYNMAIDTNIMNEFVELELMEYIHNELNYKHIYTIKYKNLDITINIFSKNKTIHTTDINDIVERVIICGLFKSTTQTITINVDIYLTPFKKKCDYYQGQDIIGPREINSGASIVGKKLFVFRKEELNKVLVHELVHYLALDLNNVPFNNFSNYFNMRPNNVVLLNESYTEILTLLINTCIYSDKLNGVKETLNKELKYSMYQSAKILTIFKFDTAEQFFKSCDCEKFKQNTDIFSYFIVKTAILMDLDGFLELYYSNKITPYNFKDYVLSVTLSKKYVNIINKFMVYIKNNKQPKSLLNTLRMTHYDL
jgi:hypothetical protein